MRGSRRGAARTGYQCRAGTANLEGGGVGKRAGR